MKTRERGEREKTRERSEEARGGSLERGEKGEAIRGGKKCHEQGGKGERSLGPEGSLKGRGMELRK